ncbi:MAG: amidase [Caldilineaceae bacterium]|nr:amidase [Caldilineaceae bacterium]
MPITSPDASDLLDRLRMNLRAAAVPATDTDIENFVESGSLAQYDDFNQAVAPYDNASVPGYLAAWSIEEIPHAGDAPPSSMPRAAHAADAPATIAAIAPLLHSRQLSPVELTEQALQRIERRNPTINAFQLVLDERARAAARRAEQEIAAGDYRGPLHGIPIAAKDLVAMKGTITTAGSKVFGERVTDHDATAIERLAAAGAIIVGKTCLSEFAYWPGSTNPHYGLTRNPWELDHDTGGSSSGSAAAVADGMVFGALGSDTGCSIRIPAAFCGIVGLKATFGRVSLYGCDPLSWSLDHLGPLTRSVEDAALLLSVLAGYDKRDPRTRPNSDFAVPPDLQAGVKGLRIGVLRADGTNKPLATDETLAGWHAALDALASQGATLVDVDLPEMDPLRAISGSLLAMEAAAFHAPLLAAHYDLYGPFCRGRLVRAFMYGPGDFMRAQQARQGIRRRWDTIFEQVDLLSTPAHPDAAPKLGEPASTAFMNSFNALGWPAVTVPCGLNQAGLPLSIQLIARPWDEATMLRAARAVEMAELMPALPAH